MNIRTAFASGVITLLSASAFAQAPATTSTTPQVDSRQAHQEKRIEQGVASGQLTPRETLRLEREQKHVAVAEAKAKADGTVTAAERKHLHKMQNAASKDIRHQKHDAQTASTVPVMK
jgi:tellurite resistance protein